MAFLVGSTVMTIQHAATEQAIIETIAGLN